MDVPVPVQRVVLPGERAVVGPLRAAEGREVPVTGARSGLLSRFAPRNVVRAFPRLRANWRTGPCSFLLIQGPAFD
jgi:hypothetical protein